MVARQPTAWERRGELGLFKGFFESWKSAITGPEAFWRSVRPDGGLGDGLLFAWICYAVNIVLQIPLNAAMSGFNRPQMEQLRELTERMELPPEMRQQLESVLSLLLGSGGTVGILIGVVILFPLGFIIWTAFIHLFALMFGAAKNGFNATARVIGYAYAPYLFGWVPCLGGLVAPIFSLILTAWGLARVQDSTTGRGAAVVITPFALCCCCVSLLFAIGISAAVSAAAGQ